MQHKFCIGTTRHIIDLKWYYRDAARSMVPVAGTGSDRFPLLNPKPADESTLTGARGRSKRPAWHRVPHTWPAHRAGHLFSGRQHGGRTYLSLKMKSRLLQSEAVIGLTHELGMLRKGLRTCRLGHGHDVSDVVVGANGGGVLDGRR